MIIVVCALCGLPEEHEARGLGHRCYLRVKRLGMLSAFPGGRRAPPGREPHRRTYYRLYKRAWYARQKGQDNGNQDHTDHHAGHGVPSA